MYQRHSASSTGSTEMQGQQHPQQQQSYPFKRPTPTVTMDRRSSSSSHININNNNNDISNISFSSLPDVDQNYYNKNDSNNKNDDEYDDYDYDDNKYNKRSGRSNTFISNKTFFFWRILPCLILVTAPWIPCHFVRSNVKSKKVEVETIIREQKGLVILLDDTTLKIKKLKSDIEMISKDNELSYQELRRSGKRPEDLTAGAGEGKETSTEAETGTGTGTGTGTATDMESTEYEEMEEQEEVLVQRIDTLEKSIQKSAIARLNDRYVFTFLSLLLFVLVDIFCFDTMDGS
jgi:hypothetical protein